MGLTRGIRLLKLKHAKALAQGYQLIADDLRQQPATSWDDNERLKTLLVEAIEGFGINQDLLAKELRVTPPTISRWKSGDNAPALALRPLIVSTIASFIEKQASAIASD